MRAVDPIALIRKRDWCLLIACCCVWLSHWVEIGNAGDASAFGIVQVPFRITSSLLTFRDVRGRQHLSAFLHQLFLMVITD